MTDLVVVSLERWDDVWRRNQYLIDGLLGAEPELRVLFVEPSDDPLHALRSGHRPSFGQALRQIDDRLWTMRGVKWLPRRLDPAVDERLARRTLRVAAGLGMRAPLLWLNDPSAAAIARLSGRPALYDMTDDWLAAERPDAELRRIAAGEKYLLAEAAAVVACSSELVRRKQPARPDVHLVRNAVDTAAYRQARPRPADLPEGRVALYLGTLHRDRFDVGLCAATASSLRGTATVVQVGPDLLGPGDSTRLAASGVVMLGTRPREHVIGYLQHSDVLLVPHVVTSFTESLDPLKLYEYQAVGKPVVSTPVAGFRDADDPRIRLSSAAGFPDAVRAVLDGDGSPPRGLAGWAGIAAPDWSERVSAMREILERMSGADRDSAAALDDDL